MVEVTTRLFVLPDVGKSVRLRLSKLHPALSATMSAVVPQTAPVPAAVKVELPLRRTQS